jgi:hypothetical protein
MGKKDDKALDKSIENEDIRSSAKKSDDELAKAKEEIQKLKIDNEALQGELGWMVEKYNEAIEVIYDAIDDYAHLIKRSRLKYILAQREKERQQQGKMQQVKEPPAGYQK